MLPIPLYSSGALSEMSKMSPRYFEIHCASWLESKGYKCSLTRAVGDGNIDIYVYNPNGGLDGIAECKHWRTSVGAGPVKVLHATMISNGYTLGWFFSLNGFSDGAVRYVNSLRDVQIRLIDGGQMG